MKVCLGISTFARIPYPLRVVSMTSMEAYSQRWKRWFRQPVPQEHSSSVHSIDVAKLMQSLSPQAKFVPSSAICQKKCDLDGVIPDLRGLHSQAMTSSCCDSPRSSNWYMHCLTCVNEWRASSLAEGR